MIKVMLMVVGGIFSIGILGGVGLVVRDTFNTMRKDWERRKTQRMEREFVDRRSSRRE